MPLLGRAGARVTEPSKRVWRPYLTWALVIGLVAWQAFVAGFDLSADGQTLIRFGARKSNLGFPQAPWRLMASVFLHLNFWHLVSNIFVLAAWGACLERLLGRMELLALFMVSGFAGSLLSDIYGPNSLAMGASGAAFGFAGAVLVLSFLAPRWSSWNDDAKRWQQMSIAVFALGMLTMLGFSSMVPGARLDNWAHGGGALAGLFLALGPVLLGEERCKLGFWAGCLIAMAVLWGVVSSRGSSPFS